MGANVAKVGQKSAVILVVSVVVLEVSDVVVDGGIMLENGGGIVDKRFCVARSSTKVSTTVPSLALAF